MPWRLILFIVIFAILLTFVTFNLSNRCNINFGFKNFENVPVFLTIFVSFALGVFCAFPLAYAGKKRREKKLEKQKDKKIQELDAASPRNREHSDDSDE